VEIAAIEDNPNGFDQRYNSCYSQAPTHSQKEYLKKQNEPLLVVMSAVDWWKTLGHASPGRVSEETCEVEFHAQLRITGVTLSVIAFFQNACTFHPQLSHAMSTTSLQVFTRQLRGNSTFSTASDRGSHDLPLQSAMIRGVL
jgi:hypothetical protein